MTSHNVAWWDINIALWAIFYSSVKNDLFEFQLA